MLHHQVELSSFIQLSPSFCFFFSLLLSFLFFFFLVANYLQSGFGGAEPTCVNQAWEDHLSVRGQQTALWAWGFQRHHQKLLGLGQQSTAATPATLPWWPRVGFFRRLSLLVEHRFTRPRVRFKLLNHPETSML